MSPLSLIIIAFLLGLLAMSFAFSGGAVFVAIPVAAIGIAAVAAIDIGRRRKQAMSMQDFRQQASADEVEFTERDQETLVSE
jgi:hypothetical protein